MIKYKKISINKILLLILIVCFAFFILYSVGKRDSANENGYYTQEEIEYRPEFISENVSWKKSLSNNIDKNYLNEVPDIQKSLIRETKDDLLIDSYLAISGIVIDSNYVELSGSGYQKDTNELVTAEGVKIYGEKVNDVWELYRPGDEDFCDFANRAPEGFVDEFYLANCN